MTHPVNEILQKLLHNKLAGVSGAAFIPITSWIPSDEKMPDIEIGHAVGDLDKSIALPIATSMFAVIDSAFLALGNGSSKDVFLQTNKQVRLERERDFFILVPCSYDVLLFVKAEKKGLGGEGFLKQAINKAVQELKAFLGEDDTLPEVSEITEINEDSSEEDEMPYWPRGG